MAKLFQVPDDCPECHSELGRTDQVDGWTVVRCTSKRCSYWKSGWFKNAELH